MRRIEKLKELDGKLVTLYNAMSVISWDNETETPEKGAEERSREFSLLSVFAHRMTNDEQYTDLALSIKDDELESDAERALLREIRKVVEENSRLPESLVEKEALVEGQAHSAWLDARAENNWAVFAPKLSELLEIKKEKAAVLNPEMDSYDFYLDKFEPGMLKKDIDPLFADLEKVCHSVMDKVVSRCESINSSFLFEDYDREKMKEFSVFMMKKMGFDFSRGKLGLSVHPFTTSMGPDDVRITNRYNDSSIFDPVSSVTHETGHALYEQMSALNPEIRGTRISGGVTMGLHESQSRFWENLMGRSRAFWVYMYPHFRRFFPRFESVSLDDFLKAINKSESSAIRVNADELTYSLHIIVRYEIEKALFSGELKVEDVPEMWNKLYKEKVRYTVKNDLEGALQDSHWSNGQFGYFPSYAIGNIYAAMFLDSLSSSLGGADKLEKCLEEGTWDLVTSWQRKYIWEKGGIYLPKDLIYQVCGRAVTLEPFKKYLEEKYSSLYL